MVLDIFIFDEVMQRTGKRMRIVLVHVRFGFCQGLQEEIMLECSARVRELEAAHTLDHRLGSWIEANGL